MDKTSGGIPSTLSLYITITCISELFKEYCLYGSEEREIGRCVPSRLSVRLGIGTETTGG